MIDKKVLVTGGAGFIGSHLVDGLLQNGYEVTVLDNLLRGNKLNQQIMNHIRFIEGDIRDDGVVDSLVRGCQYIFHLAAYLGVDIVAEHPVETMETETLGTRNIVKSAISNEVEKLIYTSTSGVYGKLVIEKAVDEDFMLSPCSSYSISKRYNEIYLQSIFRESNLQSFSLRYFNVYGPRQDDRMVIPRFFNRAIKGDNITVYGTGNQTRDFTYIDDVVEATIQIAKKCMGNEVINVAKGEDISILNVARKIIRLTNSISKIKCIDSPLSRDEFEVQRRCGSSDKLEYLTGYRPTTLLLEGLKKTYENST